MQKPSRLECEDPLAVLDIFGSKIMKCAIAFGPFVNQPKHVACIDTKNAACSEAVFFRTVSPRIWIHYCGMLASGWMKELGARENKK